MKNEYNAHYGVLIERGKVTEAADGVYTVESYDRPDVITPPIKGLTDDIYSAGDRVFFFLFDDGDGKILGKMN